MPGSALVAQAPVAVMSSMKSRGQTQNEAFDPTDSNRGLGGHFSQILYDVILLCVRSLITRMLT